MTTYSRDDLVELLKSTLGKQKAEESVNAAAKDLSERLSRDEALAVLERLAQSPGLVGITARFAKSRFLLNRAGS